MSKKKPIASAFARIERPRSQVVATTPSVAAAEVPEVDTGAAPEQVPATNLFNSLERVLVPFESITVVQEHLVREINDNHVKDLVKSISRYGMFHPLLTDSTTELVAGGHRYTAVAIIRETAPDIFERQFPNGLIQVVRVPARYSEDPETVRIYAGIENGHRYQFTPAQITAIVEKTRQDPSVVQRRGPLAEGERSLREELAFALRLSKSQVHRLLASADQIRNPGTTPAKPEKRAATMHRKIERMLGDLQVLLAEGYAEQSEQIAAIRKTLDLAMAAFK